VTTIKFTYSLRYELVAGTNTALASHFVLALKAISAGDIGGLKISF